MALVSGIFIGILLALPPGGVLLFGINLAMAKGYRRARTYAVGTALVDTLYALAAVFGARTLMDLYARVAERAPVVMILLQALLVCGLIGYGTWLWRRRTPLIERTADGTLAMGGRDLRGSGRGPFLIGLGLNLSNIVSPTFLAALAILASQAHVFGVLTDSPVDSIQYAVGFGLGNMLYMQLCMRLVVKYTHRMRDRHVLRIQRLAGALFTGIGALMCVNVLRSWVF